MLPEDIKDAIEEALTYGENKRQLATRIAELAYQRGREDERREYDEIMQACKTFGDLCRAIEARGKE